MTEELKHIDKAGTVENAKVVENAQVVENTEEIDNIAVSESNDLKQSKKHWYVLRVMGGKEKKTVSFIEKEIERLKMKDNVSKILVPTEKVYQIRNGKKISKERNFFPGYVLVEANLVGEVPHVLKNITGVLGFLGATKGGVPVPMRQNEINKILGRVDEMALSDEHVNIPFIVGESVKVIDGPFNSFHAEIEAIDEQKKKLKLMVKIFGRKTPLELNFMQVEKI